ncbi:MAG: DNA mismatch repair protein MutS [Bacteroidia bacterium]|nr:DNA mismatch repair protein MutS [Bacteroidia bacterium]
MSKVLEKETPLMRQYNSMKAKYPDAILLFRVGDFYETFGEDAVKASSILGIVLTKRSNGAASEVELAGFPYHSLENYLPKLVRAGHRVAVCEQLEDPKMAKGIVKRGITEIVSPGVALSDTLLEPSKNNFLCALSLSPDGKSGGVAFADVSTGHFFAAEEHPSVIKKWIEQFQPNEILVNKKDFSFYKMWHGSEKGLRAFDDWAFGAQHGKDIVLGTFGVQSVKGFGLSEGGHAIPACGAIISYLKETRLEHLNHLKEIRLLKNDESLWMDKFTIRNLEIFKPASEGGKTLFEVMNTCRTPQGGRLLYRMLLFPSCRADVIRSRHDAVEYFIHNKDIFPSLFSLLSSCSDIERITARIATRKAGPRELNHLTRTLEHFIDIKNLLPLPLPSLLEGFKSEELITNIKEITAFLKESIRPDAPAIVQKGNVICSGYHQGLDEWRRIAYGGKDYLQQLQQRESERTGIPSLKVGFNNVFGYYLEVTHAHKDKVPPEWIRKQTLTNAERYITPELKEYEEKILKAEEEIQKLEEALFREVLEKLSSFIAPLRKASDLISEADVYSSFAAQALERNYCRPALAEDHLIDLKDARHPVIERLMKPGEEYVPNDIFLDKESRQLLIITGPNMSGKSAVLRQTALCIIMAQTGSYVPCREARFGLLNRIFTRVGASDNLSAGESTFMVEMQETALILNNLSDRCLLLMDEIGRGTATYDGISIAQSIAEYLHEHPFRPLTLFATHYHELNDLEGRFPRIKNYSISVLEKDNTVLFLRKLKRGGSEHSFGIHVAKMAGIPQAVVQRANQILACLEEKSSSFPEKVQKQTDEDNAKNHQHNFQMMLFDGMSEQEKEALDTIKKLNPDELTPLDALQLFYRITRMLKS